jgi:hypothetical protein
MTQSLAVRKALAHAALNAHRRAQMAEKRKERIEKLRRKVLRQFVTDQGGYLFAACCLGAAFAVLVVR